MLEIKDIDKLADLARIEIPTAEKETLRKEVDSILGYVGEIQKLVGGAVEKEIGVIHTVLREDLKPHLAGEFTKELLAEAPQTHDGYIKVKKIL